MDQEPAASYALDLAGENAVSEQQRATQSGLGIGQIDVAAGLLDLELGAEARLAGGGVIPADDRGRRVLAVSERDRRDQRTRRDQGNDSVQRRDSTCTDDAVEASTKVVV
jgi:hypothetical protein